MRLLQDLQLASGISQPRTNLARCLNRTGRNAFLVKLENHVLELNAGLRAVCAAAGVCEAVQSSISPDQLEKKDKSPVTIADFASQSAVCRILELALPHDEIMAEEDASELLLPELTTFRNRIRQELDAIGLSADDAEIARWIDRGGSSGGTGRFWTLDPIDGTKGFLRGEQYAISLALIESGEIQLAILGCPNLLWKSEPDEADPTTAAHRTAAVEVPASADAIITAKSTGRSGTIFFALRGKGCWGMSLEAARAMITTEQKIEAGADLNTIALPAHASRIVEPAQLRFCESVESGHSAHGASAQVATRLGVVAPPVRMDSQAKYGTVACGAADVYLRIPTRSGYWEKLWDHAGGVLLVEEAGGVVTDLAGHALDWTRGRELSANRGLLATTPVVHASLIAVLTELEVG